MNASAKEAALFIVLAGAGYFPLIVQDKFNL